MGIRKKWRSAEKANHAQAKGTYYRASSLFDAANGVERALTPVSDGVKRAAARLKAEGEAQADRLENAAPPIFTRQQRRQQERRADKMPIVAKQSLWHEAKGLPKIKPRRRAA